MSSDFMQFYVRSGIPSLRFSGVPSAVFRAIGAVIVYAFNCKVVRWSFPHIRVKVFKRIYPSVADENSASAIPGPVVSRSVNAPLFHVLPQIIFSPVTIGVAVASS